MAAPAISTSHRAAIRLRSRPTRVRIGPTSGGVSLRRAGTRFGQLLGKPAPETLN